MANNYFKQFITYHNNHSIVKLLTLFLFIAGKFKACILSLYPVSTQQTSAFYLSKCFIHGLFLICTVRFLGPCQIGQVPEKCAEQESQQAK